MKKFKYRLTRSERMEGDHIPDYGDNHKDDTPDRNGGGGGGAAGIAIPV